MIFELGEMISNSLMYCKIDTDISFNTQLECDDIEKNDILISDLTPSSIDDHQTYGVVLV